jgi:hypothetical protein
MPVREEDREYVRHERTFLDLYENWYKNKKYLTTEFRFNMDILSTLRYIYNRYRFLLEKKYDFQTFNTNHFLYSVQLMHKIISNNIGVVRCNDPLYEFRELKLRKESRYISDYDVSDGKFENILITLTDDGVTGY